MKFDEMNPAPPVTNTRFASKLLLDRVQRPALDVALDAAERLADERQDESLDAEHENNACSGEQRAREVALRRSSRRRRRCPIAAAASVQTRPSVTPIHCTGCGQKPATTCSASRIEADRRVARAATARRACETSTSSTEAPRESTSAFVNFCRPIEPSIGSIAERR